MENTLTAESKDSTTIESSASETSFLVSGSPALDVLLRQHRIPRGGVFYLDMEFPKAPDSLRLALAKAALDRGERVGYLFSPPLESIDRAHPSDQDYCLGRRIFDPTAHLIGAFGVAPYLNAEEPGDPTSAFRYLSVLTLDDLERAVDNLLEDPATAPSLILVDGFEQLFQHLPLYGYPTGIAAEEEAKLVSEACALLERWLEESKRRCRETGTSLYLSLTDAGYQTAYSPMFRLRLRELLERDSTATLLPQSAEDEADREGVAPDLSLPRTVEVELYFSGVLLGRTGVAVGAVIDYCEMLVDGPFLNPVAGKL